MNYILNDVECKLNIKIETDVYGKKFKNYVKYKQLIN